MAYRKTGHSEKARDHLARYERVKLLPQPSEDSFMDAVKALYAGGLSHFAKGSALAREGRAGEAAAEFESALGVNPGLVMAHVNLIAMYGQIGQIAKAEQHFRIAVELDPGWVEAYYNWGLLLVRQRRTAEAAQAFGKAVELNPNYADAHAELAALDESAGRDQEAQRHCRLALESDPNHRQARYLLGRSLIRTGRMEEAIGHLLRTIQAEDRKTPVCMQMLAVAYQRSGDRERAAYYLREA
jgi:tetratricopeptide (TPR) repeat protein